MWTSTPTPQPTWTWDPDRREYYHFSFAEACWQYQSGLKVFTDGREIDPAPSQTAASSEPYTTAPHTVEQHFGHLNLGHPESTASEPQQMEHPSVEGEDVSQYHAPPALEEPSLYLQSSYSHTPSPNQASCISMPSYTTTSLHENAGLRRMIRGTTEASEKLDPNFRVQRPARRFFKIGKVFRVPWPEVGLRENEDAVVDKRFGEKIYTKIRWFVVIREGDFDCNCLPIHTYSGQGVAKWGLKKGQHAIIYTGSRAPEETTSELPLANEAGMLPPVRVKQKIHSEKLNTMSRVNFSKIYTVEHNVKVREFGDVDQYHIERLQNGFASVWGFPEKGNKSTKAESEEDDEDEEAETEDEDKETEDEDQDQDDDDEEPLRDDRKGKRRRR